MATYDTKLLSGEKLGYLISKIKSLVNTKITNPTTKSDGNFLKYNGTNWVAADIPDTGVLSVTASDLSVVVDNTDAANPKIAVGTVPIAQVSGTGTSVTKNYTSTVTENSVDLVTSGAVFDAVKDLSSLHFEIVQTLPLTGQSNVIYLVLKTVTESGNVYTEYIWINNAYEKLGDTQITLEYLTNAEIDAIWNAAE